MKPIRVLFLIHDLGGGGAEKVLVHLVNALHPSKFDITVCTLFGGGLHEKELASHVRLQSVFAKTIPGNSKLMKLFTPEQLHHFFIRESYDVEIAYLEGSSTRVIAGCRNPNTRRYAWVHCTPKNETALSSSFRTKKEASSCYSRFDSVFCVSQTVLEYFRKWYSVPKRVEVCYNTVDSERIMRLKEEPVEVGMFSPSEVKLCGVGKLTRLKGFDRLAEVHKKLKGNGFPVHTYILGEGEERANLEAWLEKNKMQDSITLLGYQENPYKYLNQCDVYVCSSHSEGFSTAATEALITGLAICTVEVSGMKELLGENDEYGIITENDGEALYQGLKKLLSEPGLLDHYKVQAKIRRGKFSKEETVSQVEKILMGE